MGFDIHHIPGPLVDFKLLGSDTFQFLLLPALCLVYIYIFQLLASLLQFEDANLVHLQGFTMKFQL